MASERTLTAMQNHWQNLGQQMTESPEAKDFQKKSNYFIAKV